MCGVEKAGFEQDADQMNSAIKRDLMLHAFMFMQSGIPVLYSGDEIGQVNDYSYKDDPEKAADSRYIHQRKTFAGIWKRTSIRKVPWRSGSLTA